MTAYRIKTRIEIKSDKKTINKLTTKEKFLTIAQKSRGAVRTVMAAAVGELSYSVSFNVFFSFCILLYNLNLFLRATAGHCTFI